MSGVMNVDKQAMGTKITWFVIFFGFVTSIGVYGLLCFIMQQNASRQLSESLTTLRPILYALALMDLLLSVGWMMFKSQGKPSSEPGASLIPTPPSPAEFQTNTIIALAFAESCAFFGLVLFFLGAPIAEFARFAIGSVVVMLVFILPKGLSYWAAWEMQQK
jgi:F0F1-type ATP synthase membrane subunit c/vacuolar-type H+-ATPase subunit K